ncbi:hypothetical protein ABIA03_007604 [Bradyrhizobium yuanmingense]
MPGQRGAPSRQVYFLVALEQLDRDAFGPADEADAYAGTNGRRLARERDTLGLDFGGDRVDVFHRQAEMVEALMRVRRWRADGAVALEWRDEDPGSAEVHVDSSRRAHDLATKDVLQPGRGGLRIGAAQMDVIPSDGERHFIISQRVFSMLWRMLAVSPVATTAVADSHDVGGTLVRRPN